MHLAARTVADRPPPPPANGNDAVPALVDATMHDEAIRVTTLRNFSALASKMGGDPDKMLSAAGIVSALIDKPTAFVPYWAWARLLESAALQFDCPCFGLNLARERSKAPVLGPLEIVMYNSRTLREALQYCDDHMHVYSPGGILGIESESRADCSILRFFQKCRDPLSQRQLIEHTVALAFHGIVSISDRGVRAREVWFAHGQMAEADAYTDHFAVPVRFDMPVSAIILDPGDLDREITSRNEHLFEMGTSYIDKEYPSAERALIGRVREIISSLLGTGHSGQADVAKELGMHPRTLHRRLQERGTSFAAVKDDVRRVVALHQLWQRGVPLIRILDILEYSEPSVLTRSCYRWFGDSPSRVRRQLQRVEPVKG